MNVLLIIKVKISVMVIWIFLIVLIIKCKMINIFGTHNPISYKHMSF
jgi:hypothetical protein